jgi:hypothetical protein
VTAFLALAAFSKAGPLGAVGAIRASVGADAIDAGLAGIADDSACAAVLIVRRIEIDAVDPDAIDITARFAWRATAFDDFADTIDAIGDGAGVWLLAGRNADTAFAGLACGANNTARAAIHSAAAEIDAVDALAVDIAAGRTFRTATDFAADIVDTGRKRADIWLSAVIVRDALDASRVMRIATDEETEVAAAIGIGAADRGARAALDIATAQRPLGRALTTGRLRPGAIEVRGNGNAANNTSK